MLLFPETERSVMDLILTRGESSAFDPLDEKRFETETVGLVSDTQGLDTSYIIINIIALGIFSLMVLTE